MTVKDVAAKIVGLTKVTYLRPRICVITCGLCPTVVATVGALFEVPVTSWSKDFDKDKQMNMDAFAGVSKTQFLFKLIDS